VTAGDEPQGGVTERVKARVADSAWTALVAKVAAWGFGFLALAAVGSGAAAGILPENGAQLATVLGATPAPQASVTSRSSPSTSPDVAASIAGAPDGGTGEGGGSEGGGSAGADGGIATPTAITSDGKVVLNLAGEPELRKLPGIGAKKAAAILALRAKLGGRFKRAEDLLRVKGIGRKRLARLRPLLVVDAPP
jgi:competence protein ComEA